VSYGGGVYAVRLSPSEPESQRGGAATVDSLPPHLRLSFRVLSCSKLQAVLIAPARPDDDRHMGDGVNYTEWSISTTMRPEVDTRDAHVGRVTSWNRTGCQDRTIASSFLGFVSGPSSPTHREASRPRKKCEEGNGPFRPLLVRFGVLAGLLRDPRPPRRVHAPSVAVRVELMGGSPQRGTQLGAAGGNHHDERTERRGSDLAKTHRRDPGSWPRAIVGGLLNACRGGPPTPEAVGSSVSAITTADIVSADAGYTNASNTSSASGLNSNNDIVQLVVFQQAGSSPHNGFGVRASGSTSMTATEGTSTNWGAPTLADGTGLTAYRGPIKVASMREAGKFVIASVASTDASPYTDVVLVTTTDSGSSFTSISVLCTFLNSSDDMEECPGATTVDSIALAVDPNISALAGSPYHDAFLYFTTGTGSSRTIYFYEFYVDGCGVVHQENVGNLTFPSWVGTGTNADTFTMVVGKSKSCINSGAVFVYGAVASRNPLDDGTCPSDAGTTSWETKYLLDPDGLFPAWNDDLSGAFSATQPDCIGSQVNWPAAGLAYDDTDTAGPGGGHSVRIAISVPKTNGQRIEVFDTNPIGCTDQGPDCHNCCATGGSCSETTPGFTTDDGCDLVTIGGDTMIVDCNDPSCVHAADAGQTCTEIAPGLNEILPQVAYQTNTDISLTWYDNRGGTASVDGGPLSYGQVQGTSAAAEFAVDMTAYSSTIVPFSSEGTTVAPTNLCIGMSQQSSAADWFGSSNGASLVFGYQYPN
jgi:hypothetical protein